MKEKQEKPSKQVNETDNKAEKLRDSVIDNSIDIPEQTDAVKGSYKWQFEFADKETKKTNVFESVTQADKEGEAFSAALTLAQQHYGERGFIYTQKFTKTSVN